MGTNGQIPIDERREILMQMMREWRQQSFAAMVNAKVAERLKDKRMRDQAVGQLKRAEAALVVLEEELVELEETVGIGSE